MNVVAKYTAWCIVVLQDRRTRCSYILSFHLASLNQCSAFYFVLFACRLYIKTTSGEKKIVRESSWSYHEVSAKCFQSFKPKFSMPFPKVCGLFPWCCLGSWYAVYQGLKGWLKSPRHLVFIASLSVSGQEKCLCRISFLRDIVPFLPSPFYLKMNLGEV